MKQEASTMQAIVRGAEMYHNNIVTKQRVEGGMAPICREVSRSEGRGYKASGHQQERS